MSNITSKLHETGIVFKTICPDGQHTLNGTQVNFDAAWAKSVHSYTGEDIEICMYANRLSLGEEDPSFYTVAWNNSENQESHQVHYPDADADDALLAFCRLIKNVYFYEVFQA